MRFTFYLSAIVAVVSLVLFLIIGDGSSYDTLIEAERAKGNYDMVALLIEMQGDDLMSRWAAAATGAVFAIIAVAAKLTLRHKEKAA